jgi:hypothetical protein
VPARGMEIQKIDDIAVNQTVRHVSGGSAEDQGKSEPAFPLFDNEESDDHYGYRSHNNERNIAQALEHAEGGAGVADIDEIKKRQYLQRFKQCKAAGDQILRRLIEGENNKREKEKRDVSSFHFCMPLEPQDQRVFVALRKFWAPDAVAPDLLRQGRFVYR